MSSKAFSKSVPVQHVDFSSMDKAEISKALYQQIQWEQLPSSGVFLQHRDHQLLERAQSNLSVVLDNPTDAKDYISILLRVAESCTANVVVQQYVFTRMEEVLGLAADGRDDVNSEAFGMKHSMLFTQEVPLAPTPSPNASPAPPRRVVNDACFRALSLASDIYLQRSCSVVYAALLSQHEASPSTSASPLVTWITAKLASPSQGVWDMALPALCLLVRTERCRPQLLAGGVLHQISGILKRLGVNGNPQQLYDLVFVLWALSLDKESAFVTDFLHQNLVSQVVDLLASSPSRKVTRVCVGTLRNLAEAQDEKVLNELYTANIMRLVDNFTSNHAMKQMGDVEVEADFKILADLLHRNFRELSTFERWASEVASGALRWGILHTEKFWRENAKFVERRDFELLKALLALLADPDPAVVCVALFDLGEFARCYPNGRVVVSRLGGKDLVMRMLGAENEEVQRQVLQCISKIMVTNWEHLH